MRSVNKYVALSALLIASLSASARAVAELPTTDLVISDLRDDPAPSGSSELLPGGARNFSFTVRNEGDVPAYASVSAFAFTAGQQTRRERRLTGKDNVPHSETNDLGEFQPRESKRFTILWESSGMIGRYSIFANVRLYPGVGDQDLENNKGVISGGLGPVGVDLLPGSGTRARIGRDQYGVFCSPTFICVQPGVALWVEANRDRDDLHPSGEACVLFNCHSVGP